MTSQWGIEADLTFSMERTGSQDGSPQRFSGTITGTGRHLQVRSDDVAAMSSGSSLRETRLIAAALAEHGLSVSVADTDGAVVTIGAVKTNLAARFATGSRFIRVEDWRRAFALRGSVGSGRGSSTSFLPPPTPLPIAPTFRWMRRRLTTTHDPEGGGRPRLVFAMGDGAQAGDARRVFHLTPQGTTIGSDEECDLRLEGTEPHQAEVRRDPNDEYVIVARGVEPPTTVNGVVVRDEQVLRTGSRIQIGSWTMTYTREEFADHGRPYGGRAGGEFSRQKGQPPPAYKR